MVASLSVLLIPLAAATLLLCWPEAGAAPFDAHLVLTRQYHQTMEFLQRQALSEDILIIAETSNHYTIHRYGAVDFAWSRQNWERIQELRANHFYRDVYVFQVCDLDTGEPLAGQRLPEEARVRHIERFQTAPGEYMRIGLLARHGSP
jgi:hypothetical protein